MCTKSLQKVSNRGGGVYDDLALMVSVKKLNMDKENNVEMNTDRLYVAG